MYVRDPLPVCSCDLFSCFPVPVSGGFKAPKLYQETFIYSQWSTLTGGMLFLPDAIAMQHSADCAGQGVGCKEKIKQHSSTIARYYHFVPGPSHYDAGTVKNDPPSARSFYFIFAPNFLSRTICTALHCCVVLWHPAKLGLRNAVATAGVEAHTVF